jgi:hypothetical protein
VASKRDGKALVLSDLEDIRSKGSPSEVRRSNITNRLKLLGKGGSVQNWHQASYTSKAKNIFNGIVVILLGYEWENLSIWSTGISFYNLGGRYDCPLQKNDGL